MLFSSTVFVFAFLPVVLSVYLGMSRLGLGMTARNGLLLGASLLFYAWGETGYVLLLLVSIAGNYVFGLWIDGAATPAGRKRALLAAVAANLSGLAFFKYANFLVDGWNAALAPLGAGPIALAPVHLPIGISFFTFQAITYVVDVFRGHAPVDRSPMRVALYISLFPQLVAGPIVRYREVAAQLRERTEAAPDMAAGVRRFTMGLGKKVLLADTLAVPADRIFALPADELSASVAWLGAVCFALQIYFDFSGYSDMAIGLGRMFGFRFPENFLHPYTSRSVREFWRRWHVTLSSWFRDYLYVPLGGSRGSAGRTYVNLVAVFALCGLWHGASLTFLAWGLLHGGLMIVERLGLGAVLERLPAAVGWTYTGGAVLLAWVLFRAEDFSHAGGYLAALFRPGGPVELALFLDAKIGVALAAGVIGSTPWLDALRRRLDPASPAWAAGRFAAMGGVLVACAMALAAGTHEPFIYFRF